MASRPARVQYPLRAHLIVFGIATLIPVTVLAGLLLTRSAALERQQLEQRLTQVAAELASNVDRLIASDFTLLQTLATMPSLANKDWRQFYADATAALQGKAYVVLIDDSLRQLVNTYVPYGAQPRLTGDPETAKRMIASGQGEVSDLFTSLVAKTPVFNVGIPIIENGQVRYMLLLGQLPADLLPIMEGQQVGSAWTTQIIDRKGTILAHLREQERLVGTALPDTDHLPASGAALLAVAGLDGDEILRAEAPSKLSGWHILADVSLKFAKTPLRQSALQWGGLSALALAATIAFAWFLARAMQRPMRHASEAALALGHGDPIAPLNSSLTEANTIVCALEQASVDLAARAADKDLLLGELTHRVKNLLSVVQAVAMRTLSDDRSMLEARALLTERLQALGRAHRLLTATDWKGASIRDVLAAELKPFGARIYTDGPDIFVHEKFVQTLTLALFELTTNAAKYGALSVTNGRIIIAWGLSEGGTIFHFRWQEKDGPAVKPPSRTGFGNALLNGALAGRAGVTIDLSYDPEGFVYALEAPAESIISSR